MPILLIATGVAMVDRFLPVSLIASLVILLRNASQTGSTWV